jgi:hypothetical protein
MLSAKRKCSSSPFSMSDDAEKSEDVSSMRALAMKGTSSWASTRMSSTDTALPDNMTSASPLAMWERVTARVATPTETVRLRNAMVDSMDSAARAVVFSSSDCSECSDASSRRECWSRSPPASLSGARSGLLEHRSSAYSSLGRHSPHTQSGSASTIAVSERPSVLAEARRRPCTRRIVWLPSSFISGTKQSPRLCDGPRPCVCASTLMLAELKEMAPCSLMLNLWALTYDWPAHIVVHLPNNHASFSFTLHHIVNVTVRVDPHVNAFDASGPDIQLLLFLRTAAISDHVICTAQYIGLEEDVFRPFVPGIDANAAVPRSIAKTSERESIEVARLLGHVREIGMCELSLEEGVMRHVRGFLVPSAGTRNRTLDEVIDFLPEEVWSEWRTSKQHPGSNGSSARRNPLCDSFHGSASNRSFSNTRQYIAGHMSATASIASSRRVITRAHLVNSEASAVLPGSAVTYGDARLIAAAVGNFMATVNWHLSVASADHELSMNEDLNPQFQLDRMRELVSIATYFLVAYRTLLSPLPPDGQKVITTQICAANGIPTEGYAVHLAARCARVAQQYLRTVEQWNGPNHREE